MQQDMEYLRHIEKNVNCSYFIQNVESEFFELIISPVEVIKVFYNWI